MVTSSLACDLHDIWWQTMSEPFQVRITVRGYELDTQGHQNWDAADPAAAGTKAICAVRAALHAIGDATPGWEAARSVMRVAPADAADRLFAAG
jgi:hypothetical protein